MTEKNSHYKVDFKIRLPSGNLTISDFAPKRYWVADKTDCVVLNTIKDQYIKEGKEKELVNLVTQEEIEEIKPRTYVDNESVAKKLLDKLKEIGIEEFKKNYDPFNEISALSHYEYSNVIGAYDKILRTGASKTPEYKQYEALFAKWLKRRPALALIWEETFRESISLSRFAKTFRDNKFRTKLETSRPKSFPEGTLVRLKNQYVNKSNRDPFYWKSSELKGQERIGMIAKFQEMEYAYGLGSRELKVMWLSTGEETIIPERCIEVLDKKPRKNSVDKTDGT